MSVLVFEKCGFVPSQEWIRTKGRSCELYGPDSELEVQEKIAEVLA